MTYEKVNISAYQIFSVCSEILELIEINFFTGSYYFSRRKQNVLECIKENWQILTTVFAAIAYMYRQILATRKGIRALLRADLIRLYNKYHDDLGYCPVYVKQSLEDEYQQYHALKGNGVGTNLYNALMALPTEPPEKKED